MYGVLQNDVQNMDMSSPQAFGRTPFQDLIAKIKNGGKRSRGRNDNYVVTTFFFGNSDVLQIGVDRVVCNSIIKPHWLLS